MRRPGQQDRSKKEKLRKGIIFFAALGILFGSFSVLAEDQDSGKSSGMKEEKQLFPVPPQKNVPEFPSERLADLSHADLKQEPFCGNGVVEIPGEECDDGNQANNDGCSSACRFEFCGDGIKQRHEDCDDGNNDDTDGCVQCRRVRHPSPLPGNCGDGIVQPELDEECDDGNTRNGDGCSATCQIEGLRINELIKPRCGDGIVQAPEECDDGNKTSGDGCNSRCRLEKCGDAIVQESLGEECDDGNIVNGDGCSAQCRREQCGDGVLQPDEECDDGNTVNGDGCSSTCKRECPDADCASPCAAHEIGGGVYELENVCIRRGLNNCCLECEERPCFTA